jgi:hypothetical protein
MSSLAAALIACAFMGSVFIVFGVIPGLLAKQR